MGILIAAILAIPMLLSGCGSRIEATRLTMYGDMNVVEPDRPDHDYKFYIKNVADIGADYDDAEDRLRVIHGHLKGKCGDIQIVDEQFLDFGTYMTGARRGTYIVRVKCLPLITANN